MTVRGASVGIQRRAAPRSRNGDDLGVSVDSGPITVTFTSTSAISSVGDGSAAISLPGGISFTSPSQTLLVGQDVVTTNFTVTLLEGPEDGSFPGDVRSRDRRQLDLEPVHIVVPRFGR